MHNLYTDVAVYYDRHYICSIFHKFLQNNFVLLSSQVMKGKFDLVDSETMFHRSVAAIAQFLFKQQARKISKSNKLTQFFLIYSLSVSGSLAAMMGH